MAKLPRIGGNHDMDMTRGNIPRLLIIFALPLLIGNLFQVLYSAVDAWVVGNFVSNEACAAIGTVSPIINTVVGFFLGLSSGTSVVISQYYGAEDTKSVEKAVHTAIAITLILGVFLTGIGIALVSPMLRITDTPDEVFPESKAYLVIYFAGLLGLMIYNIGSGILRAIGDSLRPFYFLVVSAVINTVLDLLFVLRFHMGVRGVAYATVIAEAVSAILVLLSLSRSTTCVRLHWSKLRIHMPQLKRILKTGVPIGLQMSIVSFSNLFVQAYINHFETDCMSAWTVYNKIDSFSILPMQAVMVAITTFVGQNIGAGNIGRVRECIRKGLVINIVSTTVLMIPLMVFAPGLVAFFNSKAEVVVYGAQLLRIVAPMLIAYSAACVFSGMMNGCGNTRVCMFLSVGSYVVFRQIYLFIFSHFICNEFMPIAFGYPMGWLCCTVVHIIYYLTRGRRYIERLAKDKVENPPLFEESKAV